MQQLRRRRHLLGRRVADLARLRPRPRRPGAQHHEEGPHPRQTRGQEDPRIEARRRPITPREIQQRGFQDREEVAQIGPEGLWIQPRAAAPSRACPHPEPGA